MIAGRGVGNGNYHFCKDCQDQKTKNGKQKNNKN
jgi:hypothetical protein